MPKWFKPFDILDKIRDLFETQERAKKLLEEHQGAINRLKGIREDKKLIRQSLIKCEEDCKYYYRNDDCTMKQCMKKCLNDYYADMDKYVWDPEIEMLQRYRDDPIMKKELRKHFENR